jgi:hypothetical protein
MDTILKLRAQHADIEKQIKDEELKNIKETAKRRQLFDEGTLDYKQRMQTKLDELEALRTKLESEKLAAEERKKHDAKLNQFHQEQLAREEKEMLRLASLTELEKMEDEIITLQERVEYYHQLYSNFGSIHTRRKRPGEKDNFII